MTTAIRVACRLPTIRTAVSCLLRVSEAGATEGDQRAGRRPTRNKFPGGPYRHVREPSCTRTSCQPTDVIPLHRQRRPQRGRASQRFDRVTTQRGRDRRPDKRDARQVERKHIEWESVTGIFGISATVCANDAEQPASFEGGQGADQGQGVKCNDAALCPLPPSRPCTQVATPQQCTRPAYRLVPAAEPARAIRTQAHICSSERRGPT